MAIQPIAEFKDRLKEALEGTSSTELAERVGLSKQAISAYTTGVRIPKRPTIKAIAEQLNVNEAWLMGYDTPKARLNKEKPANESELLKEGMKLIENLSSEKQMQVLEYIRFLAERPEEK